MDFRELADQLSPTGASEFATMRVAVVQSVQSPTVTIRLGGSTVDIPGVHRLSSYTATATDNVLVLKQGPSLIVLGKIA